MISSWAACSWLGACLVAWDTPSVSHNKLPTGLLLQFLFVEGVVHALCLHALHADHMPCMQ